MLIYVIIYNFDGKNVKGIRDRHLQDTYGSLNRRNRKKTNSRNKNINRIKSVKSKAIAIIFAVIFAASQYPVSAATNAYTEAVKPASAAFDGGSLIIMGR